MKAAVSLAAFRTALLMILIISVYAGSAAANECGVNKIEVIVGGKTDIVKSEDQKTLNCVIFSVNDSAKTKATELPKLVKSLKDQKSVNNPAVKINSSDKDRAADRNNILNSELSKATAQKTDLLKKKLNGQPVDEFQLSRIEADISALQREISR